MRLATLEQPKELLSRLKLRLMGLVLRRSPPDPVKLFLYRYGWFGRQMTGLLERALRGPSRWTPGEREVFAAQTAQLLQCRY